MSISRILRASCNERPAHHLIDPMHRKTVLFYCQHLLGIGHLSRSLTLCRALLQRFDVVFVQGGPDIGRTIDHPGFHHVFLPPILMREEDSSLYDPMDGAYLDDVWAARKAALLPVLARPFAAVVIELFPFGRNKFKPEILDLIADARQVNPRTIVYCSNRDLMVQKSDQAAREAKIVKVLKGHFDYVLVHSDPGLIAMEHTFAATPEIADLICYTGYVAEVGLTRTATTRDRRILVSLGGGAVGDELARACAGIAERFPSHDMQILTGPYTTRAFREELEGMAAIKANLCVAGFSDDFRADLSAAALSISLAGYNTVMDILATKTPALVYPYLANQEQNTRAQALERLGLVGLLYEDDLDPDQLEAAIRTRLEAPKAQTEINLSGAETTAEILVGHLEGQRLSCP